MSGALGFRNLSYLTQVPQVIGSLKASRASNKGSLGFFKLRLRALQHFLNIRPISTSYHDMQPLTYSLHHSCIDSHTHGDTHTSPPLFFPCTQDGAIYARSFPSSLLPSQSGPTHADFVRSFDSQPLDYINCVHSFRAVGTTIIPTLPTPFSFPAPSVHCSRTAHPKTLFCHSSGFRRVIELALVDGTARCRLSVEFAVVLCKPP